MTHAAAQIRLTDRHQGRAVMMSVVIAARLMAMERSSQRLVIKFERVLTGSANGISFKAMNVSQESRHA